MNLDQQQLGGKLSAMKQWVFQSNKLIHTGRHLVPVIVPYYTVKPLKLLANQVSEQFLNGTSAQSKHS